MAAAAKPRLTVAILTFNEEANLPFALESVTGWADSVLVLDSGSTDATAAIARRYGCRLETHPFVNYGRQRNVALDLVRGATDWVLFLDADEWIPQPLREEISATLARSPSVDGFYLRRRMIWNGKWIKRGYYPTWILRLVRPERARCEDRAVNEHLIVQGGTGRLAEDFMHEDRRGVGHWIEKHNGYATREAEELLRVRAEGQQVQGRPFGSQPERVRWIRTRLWNRMPPLLRPFLYFGYRYVIRGGFLDGSAGLTYHLLQALWYPLVIDLKYLELRQAPRFATPSERAADDTPAALSPPTAIPAVMADRVPVPERRPNE